MRLELHQLSPAHRAALIGIVESRCEQSAAFDLYIAGSSFAAIAELVAAELIVEWPGLDRPHYTLTPWCAERLGVELDDDRRWTRADWTRNLDDETRDEPKRPDLSGAIASARLHLKRPVDRIPGDRLCRGLNFDRIPARPEEPEPEPETASPEPRSCKRRLRGGLSGTPPQNRRAKRHAF